MSLLEIKSLNKSYKIGKSNSFQVLNNVNLSFDRGEIVSIIGESGSGKSTLMNIIGGLDSDFSGEVKINNKDISNFNKKQLEDYRKKNIGFIFQSFNLISHLTILENVAIAMTLSNVPKKDREDKAKKILKELGLENHINKKPNSLSGGQKQRVAIARALVNDADIILADEPTGALDSKTTNQVLDIISSISKKGKLVIMVTHSERVAKMGSRIVGIEDGKITKDDYLKPVDENFKEEMKDTKKSKNLSFVSSIKMALSNMREKFLRNLLVSLGSSIGIMSVVLIFSIGNGLNIFMEDTMKQNTNPLVIEVKEENQNMHSISTSTEFSDKQLKALKSIPNVESSEFGYTEYVDKSKTNASYDGKLLDLGVLRAFGPDIVKSQIRYGSPPKNGEIVLTSAALESIGIDVKDIINKKVKLNLSSNATPVSKEFTVSGIFEIDATGISYPVGTMFINYDDIEALYSQIGMKLTPSALYLIADNINNVNSIKEQVKEQGFSHYSQAETLVDMFRDILNVTSYILSAVAGISLFVSAIMILVVLYISVVERTKEIGILKSIGARVKDIKDIFLAESFLIGGFGGIFGILEAVGISFIINKLTVANFNMNASIITYQATIIAITVSVVISIIAGISPAIKAAKLDPVESLRHD